MKLHRLCHRRSVLQALAALGGTAALSHSTGLLAKHLDLALKPLSTPDALSGRTAFKASPVQLAQVSAESDDLAQLRFCTQLEEGRAASPKGATWDRPELRVQFLEGDTRIHQKIMDIASTWSQYGNIRFKHVNAGPAEIRVSFQPKGSWSYVGKAAALIDPSEPTMNYGWLTLDTNDMEYQRVVLHEFGHAIGLMHEHQNPAAGIPWDKEAVYRYYERTQGWPRDYIENNVLAVAGENFTNFSDYDPDSIMHYAVPNALTLGDWETTWNAELSEIDKAFVRHVLYPV